MLGWLVFFYTSMWIRWRWILGPFLLGSFVISLWNHTWNPFVALFLIHLLPITFYFLTNIILGTTLLITTVLDNILRTSITENILEFLGGKNIKNK